MAVDSPDWTRPVWMPESEALASGTKFYYSTTAEVPATSYGEIDVATIAAGRRLELSFAAVSCEVSGIQRLRIKDDTFAFLDVWYDISKLVNIPYQMIYPVEATKTLKVQLYNYDAVARDVYIILNGVESYI